MDSGLGSGVFVQSARLLARNPTIVLPAVVLGCLGAVLGVLLDPKPGSLDGNALLRFFQALVEVAAATLAVVYTTGMADAAWTNGVATFAAGKRGFRRDVAPVAGVLFGSGAVAAALAPLTLGLSYFVAIFFLMYAMPAAIGGGQPGLGAIRESIDMALARTGPTILVVASIVIISTIMSVVALSLDESAAFIGPVIAAAVVGVAVSYVALVMVGEYRIMSGRHAP